MYKKCKKIISSIIVFVMMMANLSSVGGQLGQVIAADINSQNSKTNNSNVEFDMYFEDDGEKTYESTKNIGEANQVIVRVTVKDAGYLKNTIIKILDSNFKIVDSINSEVVSSVDLDKNEITLKQIDAGEDLKIEIPIEFENSESYNPSQLNLINSIEMTGIYVDGNGKQYNIEKEILLGLNWMANTEAILEAEVTKFVPYDINSEKGLIVQVIVKSALKDNALPVKNTNIEIKAPSINNILPKDIKVTANNTMATNGEESGLNFNENNYSINEDIITINVENIQDENGNISWKKQAQDEYVISFIYSEEVLNAINSGATDIALDLKSNIKAYDSVQTTLEAYFQNVVTIDEQLGNIVDFTLTANESLSKGQIYANYVATEKQEIEYKETIIANIGLAKLTDEIVIEQNADILKTEDKEVSTKNNIYYKNISVEKEVFDKILGENGFIKIYSAGSLISTIDKTSTANKEGNIVANLSDLDINSIKIQTSKPLIEGKIKIDIVKAIKGDIEYSKEKMESYIALNLNVNGKAISNEQALVEQDINININLVEPQTQVELKANTQDLSTIVKNENIEIRAILNTASVYNKLFNEPTLLIDLPSYIEEVDIKNIDVSFDDELSIKYWTIEGNQIIINLQGTQTKYSIDALQGGANVIITADITTNNLTPTISSQIEMTVINEGETKKVELPINFIAPVGIVTVNKLTNDTDAEEVMALTNDEEIELEVTAPKKDITAEIQIINNYTNKINNIRILGRTLMQGTTDVETMQDLNNTFDAPMTSAINTNGLENVTIYYSENGNATEDLQNAENGWTTTIEDFSKVKSYLIVLNDYTMNIGESIKFAYAAQIPENLNYSETVNSVYTVYFDNIQEEQILQDKVMSRIATLSTGVAPTLDVKVQSQFDENSIVREGQIVKFNVTVSNIGTVDAENTVIKVKAPNAKIYTYKDSDNNIKFTEDASIITNPDKQLVAEYKTVHTEFIQDNYTAEYQDLSDLEKIITVGEIKAGKSITVSYELRIVSLKEEKKNAYLDDSNNLVMPTIKINNVARVIADNMQKEVSSNEYKLTVENGSMKITMEADRFYSYTLVKGQTINYKTKLEIPSIPGTSKLTDVEVIVNIPEGLKIKSYKIENLILSSDFEINYETEVDDTNNTVKFNIDELPVGWIISCNVEAEVEDVLGDIEAYSIAKANNVEAHYSNIKTNKVGKLSYEFKQLTPTSLYVKETEQITYVYEIENKTDIYTNSFKFNSKLPDGMKFVTARLVKNGEVIGAASDVSNDNIEIIFNSFFGNSKLNLEVVLEAELLPEGQTTKEVTTMGTISGDLFETQTSNSIKTTIEYNKEAHKVDADKPSKPEDEVNYIISGLAWLDSNKDGIRNDNEELLSGIEVRLLDTLNNEIVKDSKTGVEKVTTTGSNGEYLFANILEGEYLVVFIYNTAKYDLTQYKVANVSNSINSDATNIEMEIDGKNKKVAVSDTVRITDVNARNIDIGLCESLKSDLRLDKYITGITVTYGNNVKRYDYEDVKLAKVEIPANQLANATVIIDYKIVVTNEGAIANYIKKIVDYLPDGMKFNSELNADWYQSSNGDLYNLSFANYKLESGKSAEVTLTLTKTMTENNTGIVNNNAEIYEAYNDEGIDDIDSTPANKVTSEDDISAADVVISIKTGDAVVYTLIISIMICAGIAVGTFCIRKFVLRRM